MADGKTRSNSISKVTLNEGADPLSMFASSGSDISEAPAPSTKSLESSGESSGFSDADLRAELGIAPPIDTSSRDLTPSRSGVTAVSAGVSLPSPNMNDSDMDEVYETKSSATDPKHTEETTGKDDMLPSHGTVTSSQHGEAAVETKSLKMRVSKLDESALVSIRRATSCSIVVQDTEDTGSGKERSLTISGSDTSIKKAQLMIRRHQNSMDEAEEIGNIKPEPLLNGEQQILFTKQASFLGHDGRARPLPGALEMTWYRLRFIPGGKDTVRVSRLRKSGFLDIPLFTISRARTKPLPGNSEFQLYIECKDMRRLTFSIRNEAQVTASAVDQRIKFYIFAMSVHTPIDSLFCATHSTANKKLQDDSGKPFSTASKSGWDVYHLQSELKRQGLLLPEDGGIESECVPFAKKLRICRSNTQYELCPTYPSLFAVPARASDGTVHECAQFRTKSRLPMFCWVHKNGSSLWRCSQPRVGTFTNRSAGDEQMLAEIRKTNPSATTLYICDCRPKVNAYANRAKGGGFEFSGNYRHTELHFQEIGNIHVMRGSYERLEKVVMSNGAHDLTWNSSIAESQWLAHVANVLYSSVRVCKEIVCNKKTVLVHCSDGWDRTAQSASLVQMLLDPFFRTIKGFQVIICKEWLHAGHRFQTRIGHGDENAGDAERSPIFIQFLDCTWQLLNQFPLDFEFNEAMLLCISDHLYSGRFGTYLFNNERERVEQKLSHKTDSLWSYIDGEGARFKNPFYDASHAKTIFPSTSSLLRRIKLWEGYFTRFSPAPISTRFRLPPDLIRWCNQNQDAIENVKYHDNFEQSCILALQQSLLRQVAHSKEGKGAEKEEDQCIENTTGKGDSEQDPDQNEEVSQEELLARKAELEELVRKAKVELNKLQLQID